MDEPGPRYCYRHRDRETGLSCSECGRPICWECMTPAAVGLRCPEHSGKPQGIQRVAAAASGVGSRNPYLVTKVLITVNVAIYLLEVVKYRSQATTNNWVFNHGALVANGFYYRNVIETCPTSTFATLYHNLTYVCAPVKVAGSQPMIGVTQGEWWRLITSSFLHLSLLHIGLNMVSLFFGGRILEMVIGRWRFGVLYLVCAVAGSAGALWLTPNSPTAGASGAIFGVFGALLVLEQRGIIRTGGQVLVLIVLNLVLDVAIPGISLGGHLGGLVAGVLIMIAYLRFRRADALALASAVGVLVGSVILAYAVI